MEIGNMFFGNSRGEFPIPDRTTWCKAMSPLLRAIEAKFPDSYCGVTDFENEVFVMRPYYWGDCTCGFDDQQEAFYKEHPHTKECFNTRYYAEEERFRATFPPLPKIKMAWTEHGKGVFSAMSVPFSNAPIANPNQWELENQHMIEWAKQNGYAQAPDGMAAYCDCGADAAYNEWSKDRDHALVCKLVLPNLLHKSTGFTLKWYKYPLRDSYMNKELSIEEFSRIMQECAESLETA